MGRFTCWLRIKSCLPSWFHVILVDLCCVLGLCHSFKSCALPLSLLLHLCPWDCPGKNTGVGYHFLLQGVLQTQGSNPQVGSLSLLKGISPTQGSNPGLPCCRRIFYQLSHRGSPSILEWVAYPFFSRYSWPRNRIGVSCSAAGFCTTWAVREAPYIGRQVAYHWATREARFGCSMDEKQSSQFLERYYNCLICSSCYKHPDKSFLPQTLPIPHQGRNYWVSDLTYVVFFFFFFAYDHSYQIFTVIRCILLLHSWDMAILCSVFPHKVITGVSSSRVCLGHPQSFASETTTI